MNDIARESLLYDFYGCLLTDKKRRVMELYHEENLTLSEIAEETGVSRAAVHDSLKSAERKLEEYESKLGMVARHAAEEKAFNQIRTLLRQIAEAGSKPQGVTDGGNASTKSALADIDRILTELERI